MYSPKIKELFIPPLYRLSKQLKKPMTVVVNEIIAKGLEQLQAIQSFSPQRDIKQKEVDHESNRTQRRKHRNQG